MVRLNSPNGGEEIKFGSTFRLKWSAMGLRERGNVELTLRGRSVAVLARNISLAAGAMNWKVDEKALPRVKPGSGYKIVLKTSAGKILDESDGVFSLIAAAKKRPLAEHSRTTTGTTPLPATIKQAAEPSAPADPSIGIVEPAANARWCTNDSHEFRWTSTLAAGSNVKIDLMDSSGQSVWRSITPSTVNSGSYLWPGLSDAQFPFGSGTFRPRISTLDGTVLKVGEFLHFGKHLVHDQPKSTHTWRKGSEYTIVWRQVCDLPSPLSIELLDSGHNLVTSIASGLSTSGSSGNKTQKWTVPTNLSSGTYYIRVRTSGNEYSRENAFTVADAITIQTSTDITITNPTAGATWCTNDSHEFTWSSTLPANSNVKIDLMDSNGQSVWRSITPSTVNSGSYLWSGLSDVQFPFGSGTFRPRVSTLDGTVLTVGEFLHFGKRLMLSKPQANYTWRKGSQYTIVWNQMCTLPSALSIELLDSSHQLVSTIASGLSTAGSSGSKTRQWTVPANLNSGTHYIRVRTSGNEYSKESAFTIDDPLPH